MLALKRKSSMDNNPSTGMTHHPISTLTKRFRGSGQVNPHEHRMSFLSNTLKPEQFPAMINGNQSVKRRDETELTPIMFAEYRRLQHELQCQEALLVLMQKLKGNQRLLSQTNINGGKQRATATKLNQQPPLADGKPATTATKQPVIPTANNSHRTTPTKPPHPNQYTVNRSNTNSQSALKTALPLTQATRQSNPINNNNTAAATTVPVAATRLSSTVPVSSATKNTVAPPPANTSSKGNGVAAEQHLLNAKLALRKQLEQTLLQIPTPKPSTCDLTFIPGVNGWSEFLTYLGLEQAFTIYADIVNRRPASDISMSSPHVCAQCGTDWSVTWHEMSSPNETTAAGDDKILCDRCTKSSQKKLLKQDHSNRLRQAFIKALQQEKELDAKFQQQSSAITTPSAAVKQPTNKHVHPSIKHSNNKPLSTKTSVNNHSHSHQSHHHHHTNKSGNSTKNHHVNPSPAETLASTLAALQTNEQMELFQKHFLSNMLPFAVANQAAALATKSTQQQQQQQALAAFPAMAASLMRQQNPAQYLLDMIPQAAKQQQQHHHHHHHSK